jgi:DNA replication protein DnaC
MARLRALSHLDHLSHATFEAWTVPEQVNTHEAACLRSAFEVARHYAEAPSGWLLFLGGYGCGKTHLAAAIANRSLQMGRPVLFVVVPDLLDHLRATYGPYSVEQYDTRFEEIRNAPLLVLDDLGTQSATPWAEEKLYQIINHRYNARLPTVITSNQRLEDFEPRTRSRLVDTALSTVVHIQAPDHRAGAATREPGLSSLPLLANMTFNTFSLRATELSGEQKANLERTLRVCQEYAANPDGWLILTGAYGCGKTHLAAAIAHEQQERGIEVTFVTAPDLLDHLRETFQEASQASFSRRFEEVKATPFLVLDDFGSESASPWVREKLFQLFNHRYVARLPMVITTTCALDDIDPRLRSRLLDRERSRIWGILAPSYRTSATRRAARSQHTNSATRGAR